MAKQLVYTSVPQGLWPGTSGYCTVLSTEGIPRVEAEYLEKLSVYRIVDRAGGAAIPPTQENYDRLVALNPSNVAHVKFRFRGREQSLLFKTCLAGFDYSGRLRKLSHFLLLEEHDQATAGPAWMTQQQGVFLGNWGGQPIQLEKGKDLPRGELLPAPCRAWEAACGDAGWAGVLAQTILQGEARIAYVIADIAVDVIPLLLEACALLPLEKRWDVTFSSRYVNFTQGVTCQWRCVTPGSPEAQEALSNSGNLILDLTSQLGAPPSGKEVAAARQGMHLEWESPRKPSLFNAAASAPPLAPIASPHFDDLIPMRAPAADDLQDIFGEPAIPRLPATPIAPEQVPSRYSVETARESAPLPAGRLRLPPEPERTGTVAPPIPPPLPPRSNTSQVPPGNLSPQDSPFSGRTIGLLLSAGLGLILIAGIVGLGIKFKRDKDRKLAQQPVNDPRLIPPDHSGSPTARRPGPNNGDPQTHDGGGKPATHKLPPKVKETEDATTAGWKRVDNRWPKKFAGKKLWAKEIVPLPGQTKLDLECLIDNPRPGARLRIVSINALSLDAIREKKDGHQVDHGQIVVTPSDQIEYVFNGKANRDFAEQGRVETIHVAFANGQPNDPDDPQQDGDATIHLVPKSRPQLASKESLRVESGQDVSFKLQQLVKVTNDYDLKELVLVRINDQDVESGKKPIKIETELGVLEVVDRDQFVFHATPSKNSNEQKGSFQITVATRDGYRSEPVTIHVAMAARDFTKEIAAFFASLESNQEAFGQTFKVFKLPAASDEGPQVVAKLPPELAASLQISLKSVLKDAPGKLQLNRKDDAWNLEAVNAEMETLTVGRFQLNEGELKFEWAKGTYPADQLAANTLRLAISYYLVLDLPHDARAYRLPPPRIPSGVTLSKFASPAEDLKSFDGLLQLVRSLDGARDISLISDDPDHVFEAYPNEKVFANKTKPIWVKFETMGETNDPFSLQLLNLEKKILNKNGFKGLRDRIEDDPEADVRFKIHCGLVGKIKNPQGDDEKVLLAILKD